ncbi:MAG: GTP-binding protein [Candidatus Hermodarchaeota archaeon]|nr:GTP-binding protein [Candidatus Hermodarchaeota archaeon]
MSKPTYIFKVPVAGDGAVGKTSLIVRYTQGTFTDTYKMTIGTSFAVKTVDLGSVVVKLQIWDLAGQPHFGGVRPLFYQGSTGVIYVFSVTDRASFDHLSGWLEEARKNAGNVPGILIGNKSDLANQRAVPREEAEAYAAQADLLYMETSAKLDENVGDAFRNVAVTIIQSKWPEWGEEVEAPAATPAPTATPEPPAPAPEPEPVAVPEPVLSEPGSTLPPVNATPIPVPEPVTEPEPVEPTPSPDMPPPLLDVESVQPQEPPPVEPDVPQVLLPPDLEPTPEAPTMPEPQPASEPAPVAEDVAIASRSESSLVEFVGVNVHALSNEEFKKRAIHAMQRLGVNDTGVFGTFLKGLMQQGQRDVVVQSLESLQEEH